MKIRLFILASVSLYYSCANSSVYQKLVKAGLNESNFHKKLFGAVKDSLTGNERVVYIYSPQIRGSNVNEAFEAVIYDVKTKKISYIVNDDLHAVRMKTVPPSTRFQTINFVLKNYLDGKISYLKSLEIHGISGGGINYFHISDIDTKTNTIKKIGLENISLDKQGNPTTLKKLMSGGK